MSEFSIVAAHPSLLETVWVTVLQEFGSCAVTSPNPASVSVKCDSGYFSFLLLDSRCSPIDTLISAINNNITWTAAFLANGSNDEATALTLEASLPVPVFSIDPIPSVFSSSVQQFLRGYQFGLRFSDEALARVTPSPLRFSEAVAEVLGVNEHQVRNEIVACGGPGKWWRRVRSDPRHPFTEAASVDRYIDM